MHILTVINKTSSDLPITASVGTIAARGSRTVSLSTSALESATAQLVSLAAANLITWSVAATTTTADDAAEFVTRTEYQAGTFEPDNLSTSGNVTCVDVDASGDVAATGALTGASVTATGAVAGNSVASTTTVKGTTGLLTGASDIKISGGLGDPEGVVVGSVGDLFLRTDGGANTCLYIKETGSATNTGWVAK